MRHNPSELRKRILTALPEGFVVAEHTESGHFYRVNDGKTNPLYPSVTGKLQVLKDEGLANWKMGQALEYVFKRFKEFNDANIMEHLDAAERVPADLFHDAGDLGTIVHDAREAIYSQWIKTGVRPVDFPSFVPEDKKDVRALSALAALETFCIERSYVPVATEMMVYSHRWKTAGTLDDLGLMRIETRRGAEGCEHDIVLSPSQNIDRCVKCEAKWKWAFCLLDLKTSNRFKDHYFFQVAMYYAMFRTITGLRPEHAFILKVSKEDRTYKLEELKRPAKIAQFANHVLKTNEGLEFIKGLRKDNQRNVIKL